MPRGTTVNENYILEALGRFMKILKQKRPVMSQQEWFFHWGHAPVHSAAVVKDWIAARGLKMIRQPPCSSSLVLADFLLLPTVKKELAGLTLPHTTFKKSGEGAVKTLPEGSVATALR